MIREGTISTGLEVLVYYNIVDSSSTYLTVGHLVIFTCLSMDCGVGGWRHEGALELYVLHTFACILRARKVCVEEM